MSIAQLWDELAQLNVGLALERDAGRRLILIVAITDVEAHIAAELARKPDAEPLPQLLARVLQGEVSADVAGQAIARDPALAGQVASATITLGGEGAQFGDVTTGDVAGRDVIKIYIGAKA